LLARLLQHAGDWLLPRPRRLPCARLGDLLLARLGDQLLARLGDRLLLAILRKWLLLVNQMALLGWCSLDRVLLTSRGHILLMAWEPRLLC
jgi:hypothetical protein